MATQEGREALKEIAAGCPRPGWCVHADRHAEILADHIRRGLQEHFPPQRTGPRAQYISEPVWTARERRRQLKQRTRRLNDGFKTFVKEAAFGVWRWGHGAFQVAHRKVIVLRELIAAAIKFNISWAKGRIKEDKKSYLRKFLQSLGGLQGPQLQQKLSRCGLGAKTRKRGRFVAPSVRNADGQLLVGRASQDRAWMEFFGAMEGGHICRTSELLEMRPATTGDDGVRDLPLDLEFCPKLHELEAAYLTV